MYKSLIIKLAIVFIWILLFLTFFSSTIFSLNLPGVVVGSPQSGVVSSVFRVVGEVSPAETIGLFNENSGRIILHVQEGDLVQAGELLFSVESDFSALLERLELEQSRLELAQINSARTREDLAFEERRLSQLSLDPIREIVVLDPDISRFEHEARRLASEIERAESAYQTNRDLFTEGVISRIQLEDSAHRLSQLRESYTHNNYEIEAIMATHQRALERAEEESNFLREVSMAALDAEKEFLRHRIINLNYSIRLLEIEEREILRAQALLFEEIEAGSVTNFYAEDEMIVQEIRSVLENGVTIGENQFVMRLRPALGRSFTVTASFPERMGTPTDSMDIRVNIPILNEYGLQGQIGRTSFGGGRINVEIIFETTADIRGGERAEIIVEQFSVLHSMVLPNSAIREDSNGHFILYITREPNSFIGDSFYARQQWINILEEGDTTTAFTIIGGLDNPIIISSDRLFSVGSRVRVVGDE